MRGHHLEGIAGIDVLDDPRDHRFELLGRHVRSKGWDLAVPLGGLAGAGYRPSQLPADLADRLERLPIGRVEILVGVDVGEHRHRVLEMIEHDQRVGQHQRQVGNADRVWVWLAELFDGAHEVVGEHPNRAAGEWRQVGQRRDIEAAELCSGQRVRVARIAERPAQHAAGPEADERVAPDSPLVG